MGFKKISGVSSNLYGKNDFYNYSVLRRIYFNAKSKLIGFAKNNSKKALSKQLQILQRKIRLATVLYQRLKNDLF